MTIFEIYGQQKTLTQWDMGRKLVVYEACDQVHFANAAMTEAIVCGVTVSEGVRMVGIPDEVLQVSGTLWAYAFVKDGEAYTRHIQSFFVKAKPKPVDYVYTPTQWLTMEQLMERVENLENKEETDPTVPAWAKQDNKPGYTAAEVGARPSTWMPTAAEVGARASSWLPTIEQIGAAPAGYGLGTDLTETQAFTTIAEIDSFLVNGVRRVMLSAENIAGTQYGILVCAAGDRYKEQRLFSHFTQYGGFYEKKRVWTNSLGWQPWEWVNPPMTAGVEYRLTERYKGKPVYTMLLNCGTMPAANSSVDVNHGISNLQYIVAFGGSMTVGGTKPIALPYFFSDTNYMHLTVDQTRARFINGGTSLTAYTDTKVWLKYTKTTD